MREIILRCVYIGDNPKIMFEMVYIDCLLMFENKENNIRYPFETPFIDDDFMLMQYSGENDINSKKIFAGDIVKCTEGANDQIIFHHGSFWLRTRHTSLHNYIYVIGHEIEVIGNILENPELLK